ncbi:hypothetical protein DICPUDRAFT_148347 [Dictyostelium purpureum]|uniref:Uncharacterized protein n=1 Tax=Dictyostelium purpureum TaxID=5786 RepID=F0ZAW3_DICPU|nr:uncharacterized protein DICPUDRAFT_148347 [Dictyostelium purpureum]EGC38897.1 hypothetical protein DICPUDRAFT_148347 [Dictyostelium purpureum]|eukprot:XP_003284577.1 hypothetical protein DICPUDRAFT_148347 [Dictyostelium purpureum]
MNHQNPLYPNLGGYQSDPQQLNQQQSQQHDYNYQQSPNIPLHHQSIYRQQSPSQQQSNLISSQRPYNTPGLTNSLYRDVQIPSSSLYQQPQPTPLTQSIGTQILPAQQQQQQQPSIVPQSLSPLSPQPTKSDSLLIITEFDKDEDLKSIFTKSIDSVDKSVNKVSETPDPTSKLINKRDPGFNYFESNNQYWSTMIIEKYIELPKEIANALLTTSTKSSFGLFPEINRAWISIDQTLYLWDYRANETTSHNLSQVIINCALVTPKKNTFKDNVKKVMVVCTHVEIFLFALCYSSENKFELLSGKYKIINRLSIPTDNVCISDIIGTKEGRVFLSGQDGHIYEIEYSKDSLYWFSNERIKKTNLTQNFVENFINFQKKQQIIQLMYDEERCLLYSLSKDSIINVYSLGVGADKFQHHKTIKPIQDYEQQTNNIGGVRQSQMVMSIHCSSKETLFNFVAILSNGERLYYTLEKLAYIRSPPNNMESNNGLIHYTYYNNGVFFTAASVNDQEDRLVGTTLFGNDIIKQFYESTKTNYSNQVSQDTLSEKANLFSIRGRVSVIKEDITNLKQTVYYKELTNEHMTIQRRFLCLNSLGLHFITKLKYVDILQNILSTNSLNDIDNFFEAFGKILTSSLCISLYCLSPHSSITLQNQIYSSTTIPKTTTTRVADLAMAYFRRNSGKPTMLQLTPQPFTDMGAAVNKNETLNSNSYNGLLAYLGRLLHPLWYQPIILPNGNCNWSIVQIQLYQSHFSNLLSFLEISQLIPKGAEIPIFKPNINQQAENNNPEDHALKDEKRSLIGLKNIIVKTIEILSLLLILSQYNFKQLFDSSNIPDDIKRKVDLIKFRDILNNDVLGRPTQPISINSPTLNNTLSVDSNSNTNNNNNNNNNNNSNSVTSNLTDIINQLIDSLMRSLNNHNINIDQVSNLLETECPLFFRKEKRELYKVKEKLNMVLCDGPIYLTESLIRDAVLILESISPNFEIKEIVKLLFDARAFQYIAPLCLKYGEDLDPHGVTLNPSPNPSDEVKDKLNQKKDCFGEIVKLLDKLKDSNINDISENQRNTEIINTIINQSLSSNDRLVHEIIYSWLLRYGWIEHIYNISSPFIIDYLIANDINLSWKVLAKHQDYIRAANVLFRIAENSTNLEDKIAAYTNCTMILSERKDEDYYIAAKGQITTANIQKQIIAQLEDILNKGSTNGTTFNAQEIRNAISELNKTIFDYTTLFTEYARKYCLYEQMLHICHIGNHNDQGFIQLLWKIVIDKVVPNDDNSENPVASIIETLASKISNIGYDFYPNEITFPVSYIINIAEKAIFDFTRNKSESEKKQISPNWLTSSLHDHVKIDYWILVECYNTIIEKENWKEDTQSMLYIICSYFYLVESLINTIQTSTERRLFSSKQILQTLEIREKTFKSIIEKEQDKLSQESKNKLKELLEKFEKIISISKSFKDFRY